MLLLGPHILGAAGITAAGGAALMLVTPNQLRGQVTAIYYFIISLCGTDARARSASPSSPTYVFRDESRAALFDGHHRFPVAPLLSVVCAIAMRRAVIGESMAESESWGQLKNY